MNREAERKRLVELTRKHLKEELGMNIHTDILEKYADHLLDNGIIVPRCKPIGVMKDDNPYNTDVYCPYCGTNLSGCYGEEASIIIQCYGCGEYLDDSKAITREQAQKALEGSGEK